MATELHNLIRSVGNPYLKKLLGLFFKKSDWWARFQEAPAAKGIHHAYVGGLARAFPVGGPNRRFSRIHYQGVDRSLLIAGALLHDIGKLEELTMEGGVVEYTVQGRLKGHLVIGSEMVAEAASKIQGFPEGAAGATAASHPQPSRPAGIRFADGADDGRGLYSEFLGRSGCQDEYYRTAAPENGRSRNVSWTEYQRALERYLYLGGFAKKDAEPEELRQEASSRQPSLF